MTTSKIHRCGPIAATVALAAIAMSWLAAPARAETENRFTAPFHAIAFEGSWTVHVTVGKEQSVVIEGEKDVVAHVRTEVSDGQLHVRLDHNFSSLFGHRDTGDLTARITVPSLSAFALHGSGNASIAGFSGGVTEFALDGSGDLTAAGRLDTVALVVNGSGNADLSGLVAAKASATINGSGEATVHPSESLAAVVNGSGQVTYLGDAVKVTSVVHGSGGVEKQ